MENEKLRVTPETLRIAAQTPEYLAKQAIHGLLTEAAYEIERLCACLKRANDQAEHFEREWYLREDALEELQKVCELHRVDGEYAHRLAVMLECALLDKTGCWNEAHRTLDEYRAAVHAIDPPLPTFMGEPIGRSDLQPNTGIVPPP